MFFFGALKYTKLAEVKLLINTNRPDSDK